MSSCPNRNISEYRKNEEIFGEDGALAIYKLAGDTNPKPVDAIKLLYDNVQIVDNFDKKTIDNIVNTASGDSIIVQSTMDNSVVKGTNGDIHIVNANQIDKTIEGKLNKIDVSTVYTSSENSALQISNSILSKQLEKNFDKQSDNIYKQKDIPQTPKQLKHELQSRINQAISGTGTEGLISNALSVLRRTEGTIEEIRRGGGEKTWTWNKIQQSGLEYTKSLGTYYKGGAEHDVFFPENDPKKLIKVRILPLNQIENYLGNLIGHNYLFPETAYELLGFINRADGVYPVVKQNKIEGTIGEYYDENKVAKIMSDFGLTKNKYDQYESEESGITVEDLNDRNVIFFKGIPYFIDPIINLDQDVLNPNTDPEFVKNQDKQFQQKSASKELPNNELDKKIKEGILKSIGIEVQHEVNEGQDYKAMVDTANGIISVVDGKANIKTLAHEATHVILDFLPDDSKLLHDIIADVKKREIYDDAYEQYKDNPQYQNEDGSVNEEKIAKEAAANIIDGMVVGKFLDAKSKKWWEKLWDYIKKLFTGKSLDNFEQIAEDILGNKTKKLSKKKLAKIKEANERGEIYYQLDDKQKEIIEKQTENATPVQKAVVDIFVTNNRKSLEPIKHEYTNADKPGIDYTPVSTAIKGKFEDNIHTINRNIGIDFHTIMQDRILGATSLDKVSETPAMSPEIRGLAWGIANQLYRNIQTNGSILLPEIILSDEEVRVAGTTDLLKVFADNSWKIIDFKTSKSRVFDTSGDVSKARSPKESYIEKKWSEKEGNWLGQGLTSNQQQGIQLGCYERMVKKTAAGIGLNTFADPSETHHIFIEFDKKNNVINMEYEGFIEHPSDANRELINKILGEDNSIDSEIPPIPEDVAEDVAEDVPIQVDRSPLEPHLEHMAKVISGQYSKLLHEVGAGLSVSQLNYTVNKIQSLTSIGEQKRAMNIVMNYMQRVSRTFDKFINDPKNIESSDYYPALNECVKLINSNIQLLPDFLRTILDEKHKEKFDKIREKFNQLNVDTNIQASAFIKRRGGDNNPFITPTQWQEFAYKKDLDSSMSGVLVSPTPHLSQKTLQHMDIIHKNAGMIGAAEADEVGQKWLDIAKNAELAFGRPLVDADFHDFYKLDATGKPTAQLLIRESDHYRKTYEDLQSALIDDKGNNINYSEGSSQEIKDFNLSIVDKKKAITQFRSPESLSPDGVMESGRYHHLSEEYIQAREKVMNNYITYNSDDVAVFNEWLPKSGKIWDGSKKLADGYFGEDNWEFVPKTKDIQLKYEGDTNKPVIFKFGERLPGERDPDYLEFRDNFQTWREFLRMTKDNKGIPTGIVVKDNGYFPDTAHIEMNDFDTETKTDLRDQRWKNLQGIDKTLDDKGRAKLDIYNNYIKLMKIASDEMGNDWNLALKNGGLLILSNKFFKSSSDDNLLGNIKHNIAELWGRVPKNSVVTDVQGVARMQFRKVQLNNSRNDKEVNKLKADLQQLNSQKDSLSSSEYKEKRKQITDALNAEEHKTSLQDREMNLIKCAIPYCMAAKGIKAKREVEGQLQALTDLLQGKIMEHPYDPQNPSTYDPNSIVRHQKTKLTWSGVRTGVTDVNGNPVYLQPHDAQTVKKALQILRQFYDVQRDFGTVGKVIGVVMQWTSGITMSNPFTNLKNAALYTVMNSRSAIVGMYYPGKYFAKAFGLFHTDYLPGLMKKIGEGAGQYGDKKPGSFMEAWTNMYHIGTSDRIKIEGASNGKWKDYLFLGEIMNIRNAEFSNIVGLALSEQIKNSITGEMVNAYDQAHDYNTQTGEITLKPGIDPEDLRRIILKGRAIQVENQGNYESGDQPLIKEYQIGLPLMQFKSFLPSAANKRVGGHRESLIFGHQEGSWRTPATYVKLFNDASGSFSDRAKEAWNSLRPDQKINMRLAGLDLLYLGLFIVVAKLLSSIAQGIDSEDSEQKRWANLIASIANTIRFETQMYTPGVGVVQLAEFMENPLAMSTTLKSLANAVYLSTEWPFQSEDERNYKNGAFIGSSKAAYQWEKFGLRPLARYRQSLTENQVGFWK